ncbi:MAG: hypothetical protein ACKVS9_14430 [Phycisphaerae bacterium]
MSMSRIHTRLMQLFSVAAALVMACPVGAMCRLCAACGDSSCCANLDAPPDDAGQSARCESCCNDESIAGVSNQSPRHEPAEPTAPVHNSKKCDCPIAYCGGKAPPAALVSVPAPVVFSSAIEHLHASNDSMPARLSDDSLDRPPRV